MDKVFDTVMIGVITTRQGLCQSEPTYVNSKFRELVKALGTKFKQQKAHTI
jgi:hypothetical protein